MTKYYFGRKNNRTTYRLYKQENGEWFRCGFKSHKFSGWNQCHMLPKDIKEASNEDVFMELLLLT
jgi:hypothetical protein